MTWVDILTTVAVLGCGLVAGAFMPFSSFVVRTLRELSPDEGMRTMQSINRTILRSSFLLVFLVTTLVALVLGIVAVLEWRAGSPWLLAGALVYLVGVFVVTIVFNVPRNNALDAASARTPDGQRLWADYLQGWVAWNHVRTAAACLATVFFALALAV
ncbi:anthrone oxygenase family protein [Luethyella okanaganae]|uniref:DUF1772 domain-containing protein n=1 Tax=Luethyella okanaganae TaxID=69372 RepID=A0ABW1VL91_9MICO